jgi:TolB protein
LPLYLPLYLPLCLLCLALLLPASAQAQLRIEITGVGSNQFPIFIADLAAEGAPPQDIGAIVRADLERSGLFRMVSASSSVPLTETSEINYSSWKGIGADAMMTGSITRLANGRFDVRFSLHDVSKQTMMGGQSLVVPPNQLRQTAHAIADYIYQKITGEPGVFSTRIAYVTKNGARYDLVVADSDGEGAQTALTSREPIISPSWSPDGTRVAYVSFESRKPVIYIHSLPTGQRITVANYKGNNSAPSWSPDGGKLAFVLTKDGNSQIYIANADGSGLRRLTQTSGIDTEPAFSRDGTQIYFTSDRSGGPQVYVMPVDGGNAKRVTFNGSYNISPRISPDGKIMAFIARREGQFRLATLDLASGEERLLTSTTRDESPSFAANGRMIMYATEMGGKGVLAITSADGKVRQRLSMNASDVREPTWGPLLK